MLHVRLSGSEPAVLNGIKRLGGDILPQAAAQAFWDSLRDQTHPFFLSRPLWRVAVPPQTAPLQVGPTLIEWNGGQRWVSQVGAAADFRAAIERRGGDATLFRFDSRPANVPIFHPLKPGLKNINRRLQQELDPVGIFNPKRLFTEF